ncbi:AtpZ/AtpI family protein [Paracholeplasma manati]|jgi:F0F1-type ATP synthase assembly protein I|uniref:AtpZ/AtpI family protein n=1 Tax=Paracholeplasma manati TaxID=591373 RepID=A0ABT2Y7D8_9MOLU|nr:AtpZ/AtpI family protein [Paracholeplasma manati]MCV2232659.1 AtpZ/AtpI family protein [Paracholeplasma manati]MDG0889520.1 AtpZ/AtpI family protein [Paracholeplasma manati]
MEPNKDKKRKSLVEIYREYNLVIAFFYELVFVLLGLIILGLILDEYLKTKVLFTILFTLFGIYSSISNLYKRMTKKEDKDVSKK